MTNYLFVRVYVHDRRDTFKSICFFCCCFLVLIMMTVFGDKAVQNRTAKNKTGLAIRRGLIGVHTNWQPSQYMSPEHHYPTSSAIRGVPRQAITILLACFVYQVKCTIQISNTIRFRHQVNIAVC